MGLELKKGDQVIFLVDRSGSMATADCDGDTRYNAVRESLKAFVRGAAKYDPDGVSIHFFNNKVETHSDVSDVATVDKLIDTHGPGGGTATHLAIQAAWKEHRTKQSAATFVMIFTDGEPSEPEEVKKTIVNITNTMNNPEEFRLSFLTVGQRSPELSAWLSALDSDLKGAKYDIVGVEELSGVDFDAAVADLIGSSTTTAEAAAGTVTGKTTTHI
jgi:Mg-chelatase subunit ChlD